MNSSLHLEALIHNDVLVFCEVLSLDFFRELDFLHYFVEMGFEGGALGGCGTTRGGDRGVIIVSITSKGIDRGFTWLENSTSGTKHRVAADLVEA